MKKQGFTLVELLVVIAIIALLMGILMPALARVRQLAFRLTCGTNLSGIGKAMLIYANDYEDELPRAGGRSSEWGAVVWDATSRYDAYGVGTDGTGGKASISSCFYLLVKYAEVTPKSFLCKGDTGTTEFTLADENINSSDFEMIDAWDFGSEPSTHCSYSYHAPFGSYALTTSSEPGLAVAADRNPWIKSPAAEAADFALFQPDLTGYSGTTEQAKAGNAISHQSEGQNVLFLDSHVEFAKRAYCSLEDDNIYTRSAQTNRGDPLGTAASTSVDEPANRKDSLLLHDTDAPKGRFCFPAETLVWIEGAVLPIEQAVAGQHVGRMAGSPMIAGVTLNEVEAVDVHPGRFTEVYEVVFASGERLGVVGSHLFGLESGRWVPVGQLQPGMTLRSLGGTVDVAEVTKKTTPYVGTVYNLKIRNADTYFVGSAGVAVRDY